MVDYTKKESVMIALHGILLALFICMLVKMIYTCQKVRNRENVQEKSAQKFVTEQTILYTGLNLSLIGFNILQIIFFAKLQNKQDALYFQTSNIRQGSCIFLISALFFVMYASWNFSFKNWVVSKLIPSVLKNAERSIERNNFSER